MPRRKPMSAKQRKAELQLERAVKRGDLAPDTASKVAKVHATRGKLPLKASSQTNVSRRLQSSFVKFSPTLLDEAKHKASVLVPLRPLPSSRAIFPAEMRNDLSENSTPTLSVLRRPKWNYDMSKKELESNEEGIFKRWLEEVDRHFEAWRLNREVHRKPEIDYAIDDLVQSDSVNKHDCTAEQMPVFTPLFERNLEVWRQLWRVTEISQILLILLDSRCPLLHYPPYLHKYLSTFRPPRKIIFVLTKVDISGPQRTALWTKYLMSAYPGTRIIQVESYVEKESRPGQGKRKTFEPYIPTNLKQDLIAALKSAHNELCTPPPSVVSNKERFASWKPRVRRTVDWDAALRARGGEVGQHRKNLSIEGSEASFNNDSADVEREYVTVGLIGQPNVGKSSLLNALFGSHKVKASRTPGKTKHFQTLFWTDEIRLVDCPGLVFPNFTDLELQVLGGILPISQMPAVPSCIYYAMELLPLEKILGLQHPAEKLTVEDKRTWREGMKPKLKPELFWTVTDVLTAFAEMKGWITAKAGRPDINRAGNAILRALAEGKIKWAFYPPRTDSEDLNRQLYGSGIWLSDDDADNSVHLEYDSDREISDVSSEQISDDELEEDKRSDDDAIHVDISPGVGMFSALAINGDSTEEEDHSEESINL